MGSGTVAGGAAQGAAHRVGQAPQQPPSPLRQQDPGD